MSDDLTSNLQFYRAEWTGGDIAFVPDPNGKWVRRADVPLSAPSSKEHADAIAIANRLLDEPFADPDDDVRVLARQFLRALERTAVPPTAVRPKDCRCYECDKCADRRIAAQCAVTKVVAQHEETGRMWEGPRDQIPKGYSAVEKPEAPASPADSWTDEQTRESGLGWPISKRPNNHN